MEFLTKVDIKPSEWKIGYQDKILMLGSCFADNIGNKFTEHYFQATINPFGTLYNPASIRSAIHLSMQSDEKHYLLQHNGMWHSMMHHGSFSHPDKTEVIRRTDDSKMVLHKALDDANTIIVTFGTSWVYRMEDMVVANCHKMPSDRFQRYCLTAGDVIDMWLPLLLKRPNKHWIFTVSPIRHIKDGLHANHLSKANLLQAIDTLMVKARELNPTSTYSYFPAYEIMLDELRDYRFYAEDMVHPSAVAIEYIWQRFVNTYINKDTQEEMRVLNQFWCDMHHRFLHPESQEAQTFMLRLEQRKAQLQRSYPWID